MLKIVSQAPVKPSIPFLALHTTGNIVSQNIIPIANSERGYFYPRFLGQPINVDIPTTTGSSEIAFSHSRSKFDSLMEQHSVDTFEDYVDFITTGRSTSKGLRHTCAPMAVSAHKKHGGSGTWRCKAGAKPSNIARLDIDGMADLSVFDELCELLTNQLDCIIYTTASHSDTAPRARVELPLSRPVNQQEMTAVCNWLIKKLINVFGKESFLKADGKTSFDRSVDFAYQPCYGPLEGAQIYTQFEQGCLDVNEVLLLEPMVEMEQHAKSTNICGNIPETESNIAELKKILEYIPADCPRDEWLKDLFGIASLGWECGHELAQRHSMTAADLYNDDHFDRDWNSYDQNHPNAIGIGSVIYRARKNGYNGSGLHELKQDSGTDISGFTVGPGFFNETTCIPEPVWLQVGTLLLGYFTLITAPGGVGKSLFQICMALSVASGKDILNIGPITQANAMLINNEDDESVLRHRIAAVMKDHGISEDDINGRLHVFSGYGNEITLAQYDQKSGASLSPKGEQLLRQINENNVKAVFLDPFISLHNAPENDNVAINAVTKVLKKIASETQAALCIIHHTKKLGKDKEAGAGDAEAGRGASSLKDASRIVLTVAKMDESTGKKLGLDDHYDYRRLDTGKSNFSAPDSAAKWYKLEEARTLGGSLIGIPKSVNLAPLFEKTDKRKWTPELAADAVSHHFQPGQSKRSWPDIKDAFCEQNDVGASQANSILKHIPTDHIEAIEVRKGKIWKTKTGPSNGWELHIEPRKTVVTLH